RHPRSTGRRASGAASRTSRARRRRRTAARRGPTTARPRPAGPAPTAPPPPRATPGSFRASVPLTCVRGRLRLELVEEALDDARTTDLVLERLADDLRRELGGERADLGAQRHLRLLALRLDLALGVLDDASRLALGARARLRDDRG